MSYYNKLLNSNELKLKEIQRVLLERIAEDAGRSITRKRVNMNPKLWGPPGWKFIDKIIAGYPVTAGHRDKVMMLDFLTSLGYLLPCARCRKNYTAFTEAYPPIEYVGGKTLVRRWINAYKKKSQHGKGDE